MIRSMVRSVVVYPITPSTVAESSAAGNRPHRHAYQEVVVLLEGRSVHEIDGQDVSIASPCVLLIAQGKIHRIHLDVEARGWVIRFGNEFLPSASASLFSQFMDSSSVSLERDDLRRSVTGIVELLAGSADCSNSDVRRHLLAAFLSLLLDESRRVAEVHSVGSDDYVLFHRFLRKLDQNYVRRKDVDFYASDLGVTSKKLGALCKSMFGKTTSKIIEERAVIEAKRLLVYGTEDVRQIALAVGFPDHSYFSRLFRKATGATPSDYRSLHSPT